jgi:hypothetical protein
LSSEAQAFGDKYKRFNQIIRSFGLGCKKSPIRGSFCLWFLITFSLPMWRFWIIFHYCLALLPLGFLPPFAGCSAGFGLDGCSGVVDIGIFVTPVTSPPCTPVAAVAGGKPLAALSLNFLSNLE